MLCIWHNGKMQYTAESSHSSSASKTLSYHGHFQGLGMQFMWSWSIIHFSLITITRCPQKYLSRKHFCSYHRNEEGLLDSRRVGGGRRKTHSWSLPFAQPPTPLCPRDTSEIQVWFQSCCRQLRLHCDQDVFSTRYALMDVQLWKSGADSLPACVIKNRVTPSQARSKPFGSSWGESCQRGTWFFRGDNIIARIFNKQGWAWASSG